MTKLHEFFQFYKGTDDSSSGEDSMLINLQAEIIDGIDDFLKEFERWNEAGVSLKEYYFGDSYSGSTVRWKYLKNYPKGYVYHSINSDYIEFSRYKQDEKYNKLIELIEILGFKDYIEKYEPNYPR
jgi:hypothetical protein